MDPATISIILTTAGWLVAPLMSELIKSIGLRRNSSIIEKLQSLKRYLDEIKTIAKKAQVCPGQADIPILEDWLRRIKYALYDAEDAICSHDERQIDEVLQIFQGLIKEINDLVFFQRSSRNYNLIEIPNWRRTTYFIFREIKGRTDEIDKLKKWVCDQSSDSNKNFSLLSIIGTGGVGKTLLSQLIFNNPEVQQKFEVMAWVFLCKPNMPIIVIKPDKPIFPIASTSSFGQPIRFSPDHFTDFLDTFTSKISYKKFFMVLDDVWNVAHHEWEVYCSLFNCGKQGSKIIVNTQLEGGANKIESNLQINLGLLQEKEYLELFKERANVNNKSIHHHSDLEDVGKNISTRFGCLPLAAVEVGEVLRCSLNQEHWKLLSHNKFCIASRMDGDIISILELCYKELDVHLRQCYLSCALFPRDSLFEKQELHLIWIGMGFVHSESPVDDYVDKLSKRSFFMNATNNKFSFHYVLHELAEYLSDGEFHRLEGEIRGGEHIEILMQTRHLYINVNNLVEASKALGKNNKIRSLVIGGLSTPYQEKDFMKSLKEVIKKLKFLRFLVVPMPPKNLSETVDNLKCLRYLQFPKNQQELPKLSNSILGKYKLKLWNGCKYLLVDNDINKLIKRHCSYANIVDLAPPESSTSQLASFKWVSSCSSRLY